MRRLALLFLLLLALPSTAAAQEEDPWTLIEKGQRQVERGQLQGALVSFKKALSIDPRSGMAMNAAAQVASFLELPAESAFFYTAYLYAEGEFLGDADAVRKALAKQTSDIRDGGVLKAEVVPAEGEILVNGIPMGRGKFTLPVESGKAYELSVTVEDYHPYTESVMVQPGEEKVHAIRLKKIIYNGKVKIKILPGEEVGVYLDTKYVGKSVAEVEAVEGKRLLCFKKDGFDRWWRYVNVPRNDSVSLEVTLRSQSRPDESCEVWPEEEGY
jgi:tetratricopeptide (TPR) repeat protein